MPSLGKWQWNECIFVSVSTVPWKRVYGEMHRTIKHIVKGGRAVPYQRQQKSHAIPTEDVCLANSSLADDRPGSQTSSFPDVIYGGMMQSDIYGLTVEAEPWEPPHEQEWHGHASHTHSSMAWLLLPQDSSWWHFPAALFRLQWDVVQWFPELAMGILTADSSWKTFLLWIDLIMSFNNVNFDIHDAFWLWFPILSIQCFEIQPSFMYFDITTWQLLLMLLFPISFGIKD